MINSDYKSMPPGLARRLSYSMTLKKNKYCSICLNTEVSYIYKTLKCSHLFHNRCINKWLKINNECPYCRDYQLPKNIYFNFRMTSGGIGSLRYES